MFNKFSNLQFSVSTSLDGNMSINIIGSIKALKNRRLWCQKIGVNPQKIVNINQIQSNAAVKVGRFNLSRNLLDGDAMVTNEKGIYLLIKLGDCLGVAFYDPLHQAIGLAHAGWQGLDKGILENTLLLMQKNYMTNPQELMVEITPSIGPCHYGGPSILRENPNSSWIPYISSTADESGGVNLWKFAQDQLAKLGVKKENIHNPKLCTFESKDYFSHRRAVLNKEPDFRFATILGIRE